MAIPAFDDRNPATFGSDGVLWPALIWWMALLVGCGPRLPATHPVSGRLTLDGQPLANATILFDPRSDLPLKQRHAARARALADGSYQLSTFRAGDGAVAGTYAVAVLPAIPLVSDTPPDPATAQSSGLVASFPKHCLSPATSGIEVVVAPNANQIDIPLSNNPVLQSTK